MIRDIYDPKLARRRRLITILRRSAGLIFVLLVLMYVLWGRIVAEVSNVQTLTRQEICRIVPLEGILLKSETVLRAPVGGKLHLVAADGDRLKTGAKAAQVLAVQQEVGGETYDIATPVAGICCTHLDGLEQVLSPESIDVLAVPEYEKIDDKATYEGARVEKGQPACKIIDNLRPVYLYAIAPKSNFPELNIDKPAWWNASWEEQSLSVKPFKVSDKGDKWEGYFILSNYPDQLLHQRKVQLEVTAYTLEGFLVPQKAIVLREGQPGIFLAVKKKACWSAVSIDGELEGMLAVSGPKLTRESRYVSNPLLVREKRYVE